ncbi:uncharacterized protein OCT59_001872 [Rhizophagus irregularis]|uniref:Male-enhanced antigen 1 n=1 Tax=Rhizophagus irregularis TaxID=588596 RepID=A0A916EAH2_9GLOM|nr:hypothetical protein OCT59_001872 [Rhizophagus irregularis]GBC41042.1 hypothetical protein GLOIN_2v1685316 [Rhizophagus irregularis DAOM 181602=DAOM 197198]CAB4401140.1 unnamed protein product [Rhizophagus irregularis]CAB4481738.1 unnamed protein product [Rhizophagus irregularis]CAB5169116.1 unnamed protein product [Rhizophagus irregularis]
MSQDINSYSNYHKIQPQLNNATTTIPSDNILSNEFSSKLTLNNGFTPIGGDNDVNLMNNTSNEEVNSESDEENFVPFGYEALPQDDEEEDVQENNDFAFQQEERPKVLQIHTNDQDKIPDDDLAVINSIMKNIKLPDTSIPEWAKSIPEEAWLPIIYF